MNTVEPMLFLSGVNRFEAADPAWNLQKPADDELRRCSFQVHFKQPFRLTPVVHLGLTGFDVSNEAAARLRVRAENITASGFDVIAETWLNSQVWSIDVSWLAIGT